MDPLFIGARSFF